MGILLKSGGIMDPPLHTVGLLCILLNTMSNMLSGSFLSGLGRILEYRWGFGKKSWEAVDFPLIALERSERSEN